jgi:hypothetical protein
VELAVEQDGGLHRELLQHLRLVRDDDERRGAQPLAQDLARLAVELRVGGGRHPLVDEIDVEIEREHQREGEARAHPGGIGADRLVEVFLQPAEPAAERLHVVGIERVELRDVARVLPRGVLRDDAAHEAERKGDLAVAAHLPLVGLLEAGHHLDQRGLAGPVRREHAERAAELHAEGHAVENDLALHAGPEGLADGVELDHLGSGARSGTNGRGARVPGRG